MPIPVSVYVFKYVHICTYINTRILMNTNMHVCIYIYTRAFTNRERERERERESPRSRGSGLSSWPPEAPPAALAPAKMLCPERAKAGGGRLPNKTHTSKAHWGPLGFSWGFIRSLAPLA